MLDSISFGYTANDFKVAMVALAREFRGALAYTLGNRGRFGFVDRAAKLGGHCFAEGLEAGTWGTATATIRAARSGLRRPRRPEIG